MPGKRKRGNGSNSAQEPSETQIPNGKPISAVAAAKLNASATVEFDEASKLPPSSPLAQDAESGTEESEYEDDVPVVQQNLKLCTWREDDENILSDTREELTIVLNKHSTITLIGCYDLKVLKGAVNVSGANIGAVPRQGQTKRVHRINAPSTHPIPKVRGLDGVSHVQFLHCKEPTPFSNISPLFADIWCSNGQGRSFAVIKESNDDLFQRSIAPEQAPEDWIRAIEQCANGETATTLISGVPSSGKSIFARRLINRYLTGFGKAVKPHHAVFFLDLDPQSPEYTLHGQISLTLVREVNLSPAFTHPSTIPGAENMNQTIRAHALPTTCFQPDYLSHFTACAHDLYQTCKAHRQKPQQPNSHTQFPIVINTPGTLYTTAFPTLLNLMKDMNPDNLIHLTPNDAIDQATATKLHTLQTFCQKTPFSPEEISAQHRLVPSSRTDAELRDMHTLSYFHCRGVEKDTQQTNSQRTWNSEPLSHMKPFELTYQETPTHHQTFASFLLYTEPIDPAQLLTLLNGSIVHIVQTSTASSLSLTVSRAPNTHIPYLPASPTTSRYPLLDPATHSSNVICTALIRGFDPQRRVVQILVPKSHEKMLEENLGTEDEAERTVLVGGCCDVPGWAYCEDGYFMEKETRGGEDDERRKLGPWVERREVLDGMGYLRTVRRVRKFHQ